MSMKSQDNNFNFRGFGQMCQWWSRKLNGSSMCTGRTFFYELTAGSGRKGFPDGLDGKESTCNVEDQGSISGLGRFPGGGHGNPLQYSCLENPLGQRSLAGYSPWGSQRVRHDRATKHSGRDPQPPLSKSFSSRLQFCNHLRMFCCDGW